MQGKLMGLQELLFIAFILISAAILAWALAKEG